MNEINKKLNEKIDTVGLENIPKVKKFFPIYFVLKNFNKNISILSNIINNTFNYTVIYSDKHYRPSIETKQEHENILKNIQKTPISFDLSYL